MDSIKTLVQSWVQDFLSGAHTEEEKLYIKRSWLRYIFVLQRVRDCVNETGATDDARPLSILDIGPHFFTVLLKKTFPESVINTFGFDFSEIKWTGIRNAHYPFDLNSVSNPEPRPAFPKHDIVIMGEVIEHLLIAPWIVLDYIKTLIKPGGFLVLTTPNAATIAKRLFLLLGRNPFEMLLEDLKNPGHFREYTVKELAYSGKKAGLLIESIFLKNYFIIDNSFSNALFNSFGFIPTLRNGITIIYHTP
jgi:hypothetical protein